VETLLWAAVTALNAATPLAVVLCVRVAPVVRVACAAAALAAPAAAWLAWAGPAGSLRFTRVFGGPEEAAAFVLAPWLAIALAAGLALAFPRLVEVAVESPRDSRRRWRQGAFTSLALVALLGVLWAFWARFDDAACWAAVITLQSAGLAWLVAGRDAPPARAAAAR
jgi:hypothetical protein